MSGGHSKESVRRASPQQPSPLQGHRTPYGKVASILCLHRKRHAVARDACIFYDEKAYLTSAPCFNVAK